MIYLKNAVVFAGALDFEKVASVLGDNWWNDSENIYCAPTSCLTESELKGLGVQSGSGCDLIVAIYHEEHMTWEKHENSHSK
jgi:hypothetical protein